MKSNSYLLSGASLLGLAFAAPAASAAFVMGAMSFANGGLILRDAAANPTTIPSPGPVASLEFLVNPQDPEVSPYGTQGDYASAIGAMVVFNANPFSFTDTGLLWTAGAFEFYAQSTTSAEFPLTLHIFVTGFVRAAGFDDTTAVWVLTTQGTTSSATWSSSVQTIPEPSATLGLFGFAFLTGCAVFRRQRRA